jgi:hypothetical protein
MPFTSNDKNINYAGRKKGSLNKTTITLREKVEKLHHENLDAILVQMSNLTLKERIQLNRDLLPFILPKYATIHEVDAPSFTELLQEYQLNESIKLLSVDELRELLQGPNELDE